MEHPGGQRGHRRQLTLRGRSGRSGRFPARDTGAPAWSSDPPGHRHVRCAPGSLRCTPGSGAACRPRRRHAAPGRDEGADPGRRPRHGPGPRRRRPLGAVLCRPHRGPPRGTPAWRRRTHVLSEIRGADAAVARADADADAAVRSPQPVARSPQPVRGVLSLPRVDVRAPRTTDSVRVRLPDLVGHGGRCVLHLGRPGASIGRGPPRVARRRPAGRRLRCAHRDDATHPWRAAEAVERGHARFRALPERGRQRARA